MCRSPVYRQKSERGNRWSLDNDSVFPPQCLLIWHVDVLPLTKYPATVRILRMVISDESDLGFKGPSKTQGSSSSVH